MCTHTSIGSTHIHGGFPPPSLSVPCGDGNWSLGTHPPHLFLRGLETHPIELPADVPVTASEPLPLEARWIMCRGLASLPGRQMKPWGSGPKVDFLHGWAKRFQLSSQMFLYMVLAAMAWEGARIWPDFYTEKFDGMLGLCHPVIKAVALQIGTPFPFALGVPPKGAGAWVKVGVFIQPMPGPGRGRSRRVGAEWRWMEKKGSEWLEPGARWSCKTVLCCLPCTCVATRGLPGYARCFTSVS